MHRHQSYKIDFDRFFLSVLLHLRVILPVAKEKAVRCVITGDKLPVPTPSPPRHDSSTPPPPAGPSLEEPLHLPLLPPLLPAVPLRPLVLPPCGGHQGGPPAPTEPSGTVVSSANRRTVDQPNRRTVVPANRRTVVPANRRTVVPANRWTVVSANRRTVVSANQGTVVSADQRT